MNTLSRRGWQLYLILSLSLAACTVIIYINNWLASWQRPYSIAYEGPMLWASAQLAQFQNIYPLSGLIHEPWVVTIYPPLYLAAGAIMVKLFGVSLLSLRALSVIATIVAALAMFRLLKHYQVSLPPTLTALCFFFGFSATASQAYAARPDMPVIALCLLMIERFVRLRLQLGNQESSLRRYAVVVVLAIVAILVKQQAIVFVITIFLYLLLNGPAKLAFKFVGAWLAGVGLFILGADLITGGFLAHLRFLTGVTSSQQIFLNNLNGLGVDWFKLGLGLLLAPLGVLALKDVEELQRLPLILLVVSFAVLTYSMGIPASNINHMLCVLFALAWWLALTLDRLPVAVGILTLAVSATGLPALGEFGRFAPRLLPYMQASAESLARYNLRGKPVLADDANLNLLSGSEPVIEDCATFFNVWAARPAVMAPMIAALDEKRYAAVIINSEDSQAGGGKNWWPRSLVAALKRNYHKVEELRCSGWFGDLYLPDR